MYSSSAVRMTYETTSRNTSDDKNKELAVIQHVTRRLRQSSGEKKSKYPDFVKAISLNRKLWRIFGTDVAEKGNTLPADLKAKIFYLSEFVEIYSRKVLNGEEDEQELIEINEMIMSGLQRQGIPK